MRDVDLRVHIPAGNPHTVFAQLGDFARYPDLVEAVQSVTVHDAVQENCVPTDWVVYFRNGLLRWSEIDVYDHAARHIAYAKVQEKLGNDKKMIDALERAVELDPIPQTLTILADAYDRTGEVQLALDLRERAAKMIIPQGQSKVKQPRRVVM